MKRLTYQEAIEQSESLSVALGYFDGIHQAHQVLIQKAVHFATHHQLKSAVLTFSPNPNIFLKKIDVNTLLTPLEEKCRVLELLKVDYLIMLPFDETIANLEPTDFVSKILNQLNVRHVVTGFDFRFGKMGNGSIETLKLNTQYFSVDIVPKLTHHGEKIGTTQIRAYLLKGDMKMVQDMLGRPYRIRAKVVYGNQLGREIGFPTANLALLESYELPKGGVYRVRVIRGEEHFIGMCNIGHNPTFNYNKNITVEVHILDFKGNLYDEVLDVEFLDFIRDEQRFSSVDVLVSQLKADEVTIRELSRLK